MVMFCLLSKFFVNGKKNYGSLNLYCKAFWQHILQVPFSKHYWSIKQNQKRELIVDNQLVTTLTKKNSLELRSITYNPLFRLVSTSLVVVILVTLGCKNSDFEFITKSASLLVMRTPSYTWRFKGFEKSDFTFI